MELNFAFSLFLQEQGDRALNYFSALIKRADELRLARWQWRRTPGLQTRYSVEAVPAFELINTDCLPEEVTAASDNRLVRGLLADSALVAVSAGFAVVRELIFADNHNYTNYLILQQPKT